MATRQVSTTATVGFQSLSFIRPQLLSWKVKNTKPNTRLWAFFDGVDVSQYCASTGNANGSPMITDSAGEMSGTFAIPAGMFNTGTKTFRLQDSTEFNDQFVAGATVGSAQSEFTAVGYLKTLQQTINNITTIENNIIDPPPPPRVDIDNSRTGDPLAESFFTEGVKGGCYITKVDIYFQSKDPSLPVTLELRKLDNGYPSASLVSAYSSSTLNPSQVNISNDSSLATTFTFAQPIYLEENGDYCFVLLANSNKYNVWVAEMAAVSKETGKKIFDQPFIGSLFKSENNKTWTAYQTEDIKFTMYKADFGTTPQTVTFDVTAPGALVNGENFTVTSGSSVITATLPFMHGNRTGDTIVLQGLSGATYRGIPSATISNTNGFVMTVIDDWSFTFNVGANATSSGTLEASGIINAIEVDAGGSGYTSPTITFSGGGGSGAAATPIVVAGVIVDVNITNVGTGYTSSPTVIVNDSVGSSGSGAVLTAISEAIFVTNLNRKYQSVNSIVANKLPPGTSIYSTLRTTDEQYNVGTSEEYQLNSFKLLNKDAVLVSPKNETNFFGANASTQVTIQLSTDNSNVSPLIDLSESPRLRLNNYLVNNDSTNETTATGGNAYSRYLSKPITLETVSTGARVIVTASSVRNTSFKVYLRTSLTSKNEKHDDKVWVEMACPTATNLSDTMREYMDYTFSLDELEGFDVYSIKIILMSSNKHEFPIIDNYRAIMLST